MNANEHAIVTGIARYNGFNPISTHTIIKIGKNMDAVDVFDVNPVINEIINEMTNGTNPTDRFDISSAICWPRTCDRPLLVHASASANPAPSKMITSQASLCCTSFH